VKLIPNHYKSDSEFYRYHHLDLPGIEADELIDELNFLKPRLWGQSSSHWFRARVRAIESEIAKRHVDTTYKLSRQPKSKPASGVVL
jgi:hypothetical protein